MISNSLQGKLDRLWMIRGGSTLGLGRIVSGDAGRIDSGADRPVSRLIHWLPYKRCIVSGIRAKT